MKSVIRDPLNLSRSARRAGVIASTSPMPPSRRTRMLSGSLGMGRHPPHQAAQAHTDMQERRTSGKLLLDPSA